MESIIVISLANSPRQMKGIIFADNAYVHTYYMHKWHSKSMYFNRKSSASHLFAAKIGNWLRIFVSNGKLFHNSSG